MIGPVWGVGLRTITSLDVCGLIWLSCSFGLLLVLGACGIDTVVFFLDYLLGSRF